MGGKGYTADEDTNCLVEKTQGGISVPQLSTGGSGNLSDKPNSERMGELLSDWQLQPLFRLYKRLGGEEDSKIYDACEETSWFRMEKVE